MINDLQELIDRFEADRLNLLYALKNCKEPKILEKLANYGKNSEELIVKTLYILEYFQANYGEILYKPKDEYERGLQEQVKYLKQRHSELQNFLYYSESDVFIKQLIKARYNQTQSKEVKEALKEIATTIKTFQEEWKQDNTLDFC